MRIRWKIAQFFEFHWWKSYFKNKQKDAYLNWKKTYWTNFITKINVIPGAKASCLDAGCGPAGIFTILDNQIIDAVDPLIEKYEALEFFDKKNYPHTFFINNHLENFNTGKKYDYIFCINAINHVADIKKCMINLHQHMHKNSTLVISTDYHKFQILKHIFKLIPGDILHPVQGDLNYFKNIFQINDLRIENLLCEQQNAIFDYGIFVLKMG